MTRRTILLGVPSGGTLGTGTARAIRDPSDEHDVRLLESEEATGNFNLLWCEFLRAGKRKDFERAVMIHSDVAFLPMGRKWIDVLESERAACGADVLAAAIPFKDVRGMLTTAIGNPKNWWSAYRRLTMAEMADLPDTFGAAKMGHPSMPLLVNHGAIIFDLTSPIWYGNGPDGRAKAFFEFREDVRWENDVPVYRANSEDWVFSQMLWKIGAKVMATKKLQIVHRGLFDFPNIGVWGTQKHDEELRSIWDKTPKTESLSSAAGPDTASPHSDREQP